MSVTIDVKGLREGLVKIDALSGETKRATSKAINTAIPKIRNTIVDKTTQDYFISKANVKKTIDVKRATPSGLRADLLHLLSLELHQNAHLSGKVGQSKLR